MYIVDKLTMVMLPPSNSCGHDSFDKQKAVAWFGESRVMLTEQMNDQRVH